MIFQYSNYRLFLRDLWAAQPKRGHGAVKRLAEQLRVNPALVSQILSGKKSFTLEQGHRIARNLDLSSLETDYLLLLIEEERAGTHELKAYYSGKLALLRNESQKVVKRVTKDIELDEAARTVFYSSWLYSAVRLLTSIKGLDSAAAIGERLQIPTARAQEVLRFLTRYGLCREENGTYLFGPQVTHLEQGSPFLPQHHVNWRIRALQRIERRRDDELSFTAPITMSREDFAVIREELLAQIQKLAKRVKSSKAESLYCLTIDLFEVG